MLYAPKIKSPDQGDVFNRGLVEIVWDQIPVSDDPYIPDTTYVTYELEYTEKYEGDNTNWLTLKRRIPFGETTYIWQVGKLVKSKTVRLRIRSKDVQTQETSDWSISNEFAINVYELVAPAIVSPIPNTLYTDFILVILDESLTKNTYNQKVTYTLEYSSSSRETDWTTIVSNLPFGRNVIRWNIDRLPSADDYVLQLTAKDATEEQTARSFVHNIRVQQSGVFIIDTKPPQAVLEIQNSSRVTNQTQQVINIFAEDATTEVKSIQLRECNASDDLRLGDINGLDDGIEDTCDSLESILNAKIVNPTSKLEWNFESVDTEGNPVSAIKKIEGLFADAGGNLSLQESVKVFLPVFAPTTVVSDFTAVIEQRVNTVSGETATYEVIYAGTEAGELYVLEPYARLIYQLAGLEISQVVEFNDTLMLFAYNESSSIGYVYRHDGSDATLIQTFSESLSRAMGAVSYGSNLYVGLENGELWKYDGSTFTQLTSFNEAINTVFADRIYLYIGFQNSDTLTLYNGTSFTTLELEE